MKNILWYSLILFLFCASCQKNTSDSTNYKTVITGKISNRDFYPDIKTVKLLINDFRAKEFFVTDSIKPDGSFRLEFDLFWAQDVKLEKLVDVILIHPGDSLHLDIDFRNLDQIQFSGDAALTNEQILKYNFSSASSKEYDKKARKKLTVKDVEPFYAEVKQNMLEKLDDFKKQLETPTEDFNTYTTNEINLFYIQEVATFGALRRYHHRNDSTFHLPDDYFDVLNDVDKLFNNDFINPKSYRLLGHYFNELYQVKSKQDDANQYNRLDRTFEEIITNIDNRQFREMLLALPIYSTFCQNKMPDFINDSAFIKKNITLPAIKTQLELFYAKVQNHMNHPDQLSDSLRTKVDVSKGKELFDHILDNNKGKVIYIDFWTTWCDPCRGEMPNSKKMANLYTDKPVSFVYICLNQSKTDWEKYIKEYDITGQNYICTKEQALALQRSIDIHSFPTYMLVDKNSTIIEKGSYLRPNRPSTIEKIDKLLN